MLDTLYTGSLRAPRTRTALLLLGSALFATGCDSVMAPDAATLPGQTAVAVSTSSAVVEAEVRAVTRALALAMRDRSVRLAVRDAMRDSPWNEHKIVLQEFLGSSEGAPVLAAAAAAAGQQTSEFASRVRALPEMDFYVPGRGNRRTWQGTPNVVIAGTLNPEGGRIYGFRGDGQEIANVLHGSMAMLLHPAEPKLRRSKPQRRGQGEVIQSAADGETAQSLVWIYPNGDSTVVDVDAVLEGRDPRFKVLGKTSAPTLAPRRYGTVTPTPVNPSMYTYAYLEYFKIYFKDGGGNVELRFDVKFYDPSGSHIGTARWANNEVPDEGQASPGIPLIAHMPPTNSAAKISIHVWEEDCGCFGNDNDHYGTRDFIWSDRNETRSVIDGSSVTTDIELNWVPRAASALARYALDDVWAYTGSWTHASVVAYDQYGYRLVNQQHSVTSWYTGNASVATASSTGGAYGQVNGHAPGQTQLFAVVNGTTTVSSAVTVEDYVEPEPEPCGPADYYC